ncbi:Auxin-binding protein 1 [Bienertia sinuspersici]
MQMVRLNWSADQYNQLIKDGKLLSTWSIDLAKYMEEKLKFDIIKKMREHFIIPNNEVYDKLALQRVDKKLKNNTMTLYQVDILKLSQIGKEARSLKCQTNIMSVNSYANLRADYEAEHGKSMGLIEAWERSHMRKDGSFVEGTTTEDFFVKTLKFTAPSTSYEEDLEEEASDVYGVRGLSRKEGYGKCKMKFVEFDLYSNSSPCNKKKEDLEKQNEELSVKYNENNNLLKTVVT